MVLGELVGRRTGERPDGQVEPGRTELTLVATVGEPVEDAVPWVGGENVRHHLVDLGVTSAAPLVGERTRIADAREYEPMADPLDGLAVPREPADRADRPGRPQQAIRVSEPRLSCERAAELGSSATPERLSFASEGWHAYVVSRTSSLVVPGTTASP